MNKSSKIKAAGWEAKAAFKTPLKDKSFFILRDNDNPGIVYAKNSEKEIILAGENLAPELTAQQLRR